MSPDASEQAFLDRVDEYTKPLIGWLGYGSAFVALVASIASIVLGLRDLLNLEGPGWAIVLAWFAVVLSVSSLAGVSIEQFRHRRDVARLLKQERASRLELVVAHQQQLDAQRTSHREREAALEVKLADSARNARVAVALPSIHAAFHQLRDAKYLVDAGAERADWEYELVKSLRAFATAFSSITGAPCRACIKRLVADDDAPQAPADVRFFSVLTFCRDTGNKHGPTDLPSPLHKNTDFANVWDGGGARWFFSNDLDLEPNYLNEHRDGDPARFEYNATIVWPIQKRQSDIDVHLFGFLCVDSIQKDVFVNNTDGELGAAYADGLYTAIGSIEPDQPLKAN